MMDKDERIEALRKAERLLNEAADLMDESLRMSGMEMRSGRDSDVIRRIASSPEYGGSLANIARDMECEEQEQPCWTQPLTSPKNQPFPRTGKPILSIPAIRSTKRASDEDLGVCESQWF